MIGAIAVLFMTGLVILAVALPDKVPIWPRFIIPTVGLCCLGFSVYALRIEAPQTCVGHEDCHEAVVHKICIPTPWWHTWDEACRETPYTEVKSQSSSTCPGEMLKTCTSLLADCQEGQTYRTQIETWKEMAEQCIAEKLVVKRGGDNK